MQVQRSGTQRPPATGWNWGALLPRTGWGWTSAALFAAAAVALALALGAMAVVGPGAWNQAFAFTALGSLAGAFLAGLVGIVFGRERSPLPMLAVGFGALAILFMVAEVVLSLAGVGP